MSRATYPVCKQSGVGWIGNLPEAWGLAPVRRLFEIKKRIAGTVGFSVLSITQRGIKVKDTNSNEGQLSQDYSKYQLVQPDDFAMNHMDLLTGYVDISTLTGVTSPDYRVFSTRYRSETLGRYYLYVFQLCYSGKIFYSLGQGSSQLGRWRLPADQFNSFTVPVPSIGEQRAIASFLDRETEKLDTLIAKQERLIELLQEKRQAVISHAVTKGLNPEAPMKDSGVEWLGKLPAHWDIPPMRAIANVVRGASPRPAGDLRYFGGDAIPWITVSEITKDDAMYVSETAEGLTAEGREFSRVFPARTLLFSNSGATLGVPKICSMAACANDGVVGLLSLDPRVNIEFLYFLLLTTTQKLREEIKQGAGQPNLNTSIVKGIRTGLPPRPEQQHIVEHIKATLAKLNTLTASAHRSIELMHEHRAALISAAVTGKIDVRCAA